jgi:bifunctional enzyme CysN/CysC
VAIYVTLLVSILMATTIEIDDELLREAMATSGAASQKALIEDSLRLLMHTRSLSGESAPSANVRWQALDIDKRTRAAMKRHRPCVVWFTGLSGAGKSTIANVVERKLHEAGRHTFLLDGDNVRQGLNRDLGFSSAERIENVRRVGEVAHLMVEAGLIILVAVISPFREQRRVARGLNAPGEFFEIFVDAPLAVAEARDPKGLYRKARAGLLPNFTGIDAPYEPPEQPEMHVDTVRTSPEDAAHAIVAMLDSASVFSLG